MLPSDISMFRGKATDESVLCELALKSQFGAQCSQCSLFALTKGSAVCFDNREILTCKLISRESLHYLQAEVMWSNNNFVFTSLDTRSIYLTVY